MSKELDVMKYYDKIDNTLCLNNNRCNIEFAISKDENIDCKNAYEMAKCLDNIKQAMQELQAIKDAKPSDAMECVNYIKVKLSGLRYECERAKNHRCDDLFIQEHIFTTIENYILNAQENARSEEILQKYYQEGITLDSVRALKQELDKNKKVINELKTLIKCADLSKQEIISLVVLKNAVKEVL